MTIENMTLAEAINEHGNDILHNLLAESFKATKDAKECKAANAGYDGKVHTVHHGIGDHEGYRLAEGKDVDHHFHIVEHKQHGYVGEVSHKEGERHYTSMTEHGDDVKHHSLGHAVNHVIRTHKEELRSHELPKHLYESMANLTEAVINKNALVTEELFNDIILEKIAYILENPRPVEDTEMTIADLVESYGEDALDALTENLTVSDLVEEFGPEVLDELSKDTLKSYAHKATDNLDRNSFKQGIRAMRAPGTDKKLDLKVDNRNRGIKRAIDKLAK